MGAIRRSSLETRCSILHHVGFLWYVFKHKRLELRTWCTGPRRPWLAQCFQCSSCVVGALRERLTETSYLSHAPNVVEVSLASTETQPTECATRCRVRGFSWCVHSYSVVLDRCKCVGEQCCVARLFCRKITNE